MIWRVGCAICFLIFFALRPGVGYAQDPELVDIVKDGFYGGLAGALVGAAFLSFTSNPEDHLNDIYIGAGIGVVAGTAYGVYSASRVFAEFKGSRLTWRFPFPQIVFVHSPAVAGVGKAEIRASLLRIHF